MKLGLGLGTQYTPAGAPMFTGPLLDKYSTDVQVAYSFRLLKTVYAGNCIRVRRSSDNAESNIGFTTGFLNTAALLSFVGAGNGFVTTWYDQSGNGVNATQATAVQQPKIVSGGVLQVSPVNGLAAMKTGTDYNLNYNYTTNITGQYIYSVSKISGDTVYLGRNTSVAIGIAQDGVGTACTFHWGEEEIPPIPMYYNRGVLVHSPVDSAPTRNELYDSASATTSILTFKNVNGTINVNVAMTIGYGAVGISYFPDNMQEWVHYSTGLSSQSGIEKNMEHNWP